MTFNIFLGGAWDGEAESNTLLFELKRNWTGLLIEPNKQNFVNMMKKHRKTWMLEACLAVNNKYEKIEFLNLVSSNKLFIFNFACKILSFNNKDIFTD